MNSDTREITIPSCEFKISKLVDVDEKIVELSKTAMSLVWEKHHGGHTQFKVAFCNRIRNQDKTLTENSSTYYMPNDPPTPTDDTIAIAMGGPWFGYGLPQEYVVVLLSAHEAMHRCQYFNGEAPIPSKNHGNFEDYINDQHENEAMEESLHVFKKIFPEISLSFNRRNRPYSTPEKSKY